MPMGTNSFIILTLILKPDSGSIFRNKTCKDRCICLKFFSRLLERYLNVGRLLALTSVFTTEVVTGSTAHTSWL